MDELNLLIQKSEKVGEGSGLKYHIVLLKDLDESYKVEVEDKKIFNVDSLKKFD